MNNQPYIVGIDGGTQSTKVAIFDLQGRIVSYACEALKPLDRPSSGVAEHPGDDLWDSLSIACHKAVAQLPKHDVDNIEAVGLCSIRCCRALLRQDGSLATPVINWMDARLSKNYQHENLEVAYVTTASGYLSHRLTGNFKDTVSNYEGPWPIDKDHWQWSDDPQVIRDHGLHPEQLFELVNPGEVLGSLSERSANLCGLPNGIPVIATANDKAVEALGAGLRPGSTGLISLGTNIGGMVYGSSNRSNGAHFFSNMASVPQHYLYESSGVRQGMGIVSWFKQLIGEEQNAELEHQLNSEAVGIPPGADGLITLTDWLAPSSQKHKRGSFIGLNAQHGRAHMYRSILEGIAMTMKNNMDAMCSELSIELEQIIISGGGSNSDLFMQIIADVFNLPTLRNRVNNAASLGSAISAAVAIKAYDSFDDAVKNMVVIEQQFEPSNTSSAFYTELNEQIYQPINTATDVILQRSHRLRKTHIAEE